MEGERNDTGVADKQLAIPASRPRFAGVRACAESHAACRSRNGNIAKMENILLESAFKPRHFGPSFEGGVAWLSIVMFALSRRNWSRLVTVLFTPHFLKTGRNVPSPCCCTTMFCTTGKQPRPLTKRLNVSVKLSTGSDIRRPWSTDRLVQEQRPAHRSGFQCFHAASQLRDISLSPMAAMAVVCRSEYLKHRSC